MPELPQDQTSPTTPPGKISFGPASILGSAGALTAFVLALIAFIEGDRTEETIGALVVGALVLREVVKGRMDQALAQIDATAKIASVKPEALHTLTGGTGQLESGADPDEEGPGDDEAPEAAAFEPPAILPTDEGDGQVAAQIEGQR